jgi:formate dehydrogenase subunit beta
MLSEIKARVESLLKSGKVDVFLAYKQVQGHALPYVFKARNIGEIEHLAAGPVRYSLEKIAARMHKAEPDLKIGLLARECNQRTLNILASWNQINPDNIEKINLSCCPSRLHEGPDCSHLGPFPDKPAHKPQGIDNTMSLEDLDAISPGERLSRWVYEFEKCIKCYGCRNICPVCFCSECSLEHPEFMGGGKLPPDVPLFHLARAVHMAGRCIDCGLCEEACPMDIPLRLLYAGANRIVQNLFVYQVGMEVNQSPFNVLGEEVVLKTKPLVRAAGE